ncbi:MAG: hypothetical protein H0T79_03100, partial [Deltaproteobacteria bacterium]|nr:hypothetical protein [Deltaproteobacteria bacterium]
MRRMMVAPDGREVAIWHNNDGVRLVELATHTTRTLAVLGEIDVAFVGDDLLVRNASGLRRFDRATLTCRHDEPLATGARLFGGLGAYAVVTTGDATTQLEADPTRRTTIPCDPVVRWVHPGDQGTLVLVGATAVAIWDRTQPATVRASALRIPDGARASGTCGQLRSMWFLTERGTLEVQRIADGRARAVEVPGSVSEVWSHPLSSWLVVRVDDQLHRLTLATGRSEPFASDIPPAQAIVLEGLEAHLLQDTTEGVHRVNIAGTRPDRVEARRAP